jgi:hypothetical protein
MITTEIAVLFNVGRPENILGPAVLNALSAFPARVVAIVILTIYGMFVSWSRFHVCDEVQQSFQAEPALAYGNSAPTVSVPIGMFGIKASTNHCVPNRIHGIFTKPMSAFTSALLCRAFDMKTTARASMAGQKRVACDDTYTAAFAFAEPSTVPVLVGVGVFGDSQPVEFALSKIVPNSMHGLIIAQFGKVCLAKDHEIVRTTGKPVEAIRNASLLILSKESGNNWYNRIHKGKAKRANLRGYRIPFYDRPPASDALISKGLPVVISDRKRNQMLGTLSISRYGLCRNNPSIADNQQERLSDQYPQRLDVSPRPGAGDGIVCSIWRHIETCGNDMSPLFAE